MYTCLGIPDEVKSDIEAMGHILLVLDQKFGSQFKFYPQGNHGRYSGIGLFAPELIPLDVQIKITYAIQKAYRQYKSGKYFSWFYIAFRFILSTTIAYLAFKLSERM